MEENECAAADANRIREAVARIILGPKSCWNYGHARGWKLSEWSQYPETTRALAKADEIVALLAPTRAAADLSQSSVGGSEYNTIQTLIDTGRVQP